MLEQMSLRRPTTFLALVILSFAANTMLIERIHAQGCFNNPHCWRNQVGWPRSRAKTNVMSWDMDSGSFQANYAWQGFLASPNLEFAANHAAYEWTIGNLTWDQKDSCAQARSTGNTVTCIGLQDWCSWLRREGVTGLTSIVAVNKVFRDLNSCNPNDPDNYPVGWGCVYEGRVRLNGYVAWWDMPECGGATVAVGAPVNPSLGDWSDPRFNNTCDGRVLPTLAVRDNAALATVHEFGHSLYFYDIPLSTCLPQQTVMEGHLGCGLLLVCPNIFRTSNDDYGVRFLYGP